MIPTGASARIDLPELHPVIPENLAAQRQGSAGPWHKVFAGWRRSKYFMPWSRMYPIVGRNFLMVYFDF